MHCSIFYNLSEEGKIVKGVNTTPDVNMDSIKIETGKFNNIVDTNGIPPEVDYENIKKSIIDNKKGQ